MPTSPVADALYADEDVEGVTALSWAAAPEWLRRLHIPTDWQLLTLPDAPDQPITRLAVTGPLGNGEWEAADTINAFGYTGWLVFDDILRNAGKMVRDLNSTDVVVKVLPVPPLQWTAAVRSHGIANIEGRNVWVQQSNYIAGSEQSAAGRLIVHNLFVDSVIRDGRAEEISQLSNDVYQGFVDALGSKHPDR